MDVLVERWSRRPQGHNRRLRAEAGEGREATKQVRSFGTMTADLLALRDWLIAMGVTLVGMESTRVYWTPIPASRACVK